MSLRKERGVEIAQDGRISKRNGYYLVPSQTDDEKSYTVRIGKTAYCSCPDFAKRGDEIGKCKHIYAVEIKYTTQKDHYGNTTVTKTTRVTYSQEWSAYDRSQTTEKDEFMKLLDDLCAGVEQPTKAGAGRPSHPLRDMVFASAMKVYTTFSLRRFVSDMRTAQERGYILKTPHYSRLARYMRDPKLTPILERMVKITSLPLSSVETQFAVDSTGFSTSMFSRWFDHRYGKEKLERAWLKAHAMVGVKTNIITAVRVTEGSVNDLTKFGELVEDTSTDFDMKEVSADKGYSSREALEIVDGLGATPYIMFRRNSTAHRTDDMIWKKMYHYFALNQEEFMRHYHKRSNVEATFSMIKRKFGTSVRNKTKAGQVNEILLKVICHNVCVIIQEKNELKIGGI